MAAWIWFVGALGLSIAELLGGEFVLLMLGGGAIAGGITALITDQLWLQLLVFAVVSAALVVVARPALLRKFHGRPAIATGIEAIVGAPATVLEQVTETDGRVKVMGEVWSAIGLPGHDPLPPGAQVNVVEVRGATVVVIWGN